MPPKAASRGRKRAALVASDASQPEPPALPQDVNEELSFEGQVQSTPRPRGRPPKNKPIAQSGLTPEPQSAPAPESQPRRRGRPPGAKKQEPDTGTQPSQTDGPAAATVTASQVHVTAEPSDGPQETINDETPKPGRQVRKRKRGRPSLAETAAETQPQQEEEPPEPQKTQKRKRGRPPAEEKEQAQGEPSEDRTQQPPPSTTAEASAIEADPPAKKPRGRPRRSDVSLPFDPPPPESQSQPKPKPKLKPKPRGRPRTSNISAAEPPQSPKPKNKSKAPRPSTDVPTTEPVPKKRRVTADSMTDVPAPPKPSMLFRHIGTKPASIPRARIEATWIPLPAPSIAIVTSLLHLAERPVLQRLATNTKRRDHAAFALRTVSHNLARKLARRFPFPPAASGAPGRTRAVGRAAARDADPRDEELDYERCIDAIRRLREDARKAHPLVPDERGKPAVVESRPADRTLHVADAPPQGLFQDIDMPGLEGIGARLGSHMESLRANLQPVEHVVPEIARSRAVLRAVLAQHLEPQQFQQVLLG
ncbi:predicted protein [Verticillium alfalfae VaMs.102]|uniref:Predicted protein n=1 Tax=Verticillium alfalfae (strain VaMs.102 / ATCC MYA-4576 / FGSC 10136) TaxID=526221 RepID=C9SKI7_VERA1|nr:predicted protein [Verticillium alfalfae VaMs.102]EEY19205.1 predicted protein [Verticillium alfalfae VaMs.102]